MATFKIVLDTRTKKKGDKFNLAVRMVNGNDVMYLNISNITQQQYDQTFIKKSKDEKSIEFRETCNGYITKCERIFSELKPFNKERLRELFYDKDKEVPKTLLLKDLLKYYFEQNEFITIRTKGRYQTSINVLNTFKKDVTVGDITVNFLKRFDKYFRDKGGSPATVSGYLTDVRRIINYFREIVKLIPKEYEYPFGKGGYSIKSYNPKKIVLKSDEIQSVIDLTEFDTCAQEYARDVWLFLYLCNGINFADLLLMRWENIQRDFLIFFRKKTKNTRTKNVKEITAPIYEDLRKLIEKIGNKNSPFIIGKLKEGYSENTFENKSHKMRRSINIELRSIQKKLNLSVPIKLGTARSSYATTLLRNGQSKTRIGEMLGHGSYAMIEHYCGGLDLDTIYEVNKSLYKNTPGFTPGNE